MRIKLSRLFGFFLFMAILFLGCRSENDFVENNIIIEKTPQKFYIFETKNNSAFYSKNAEGFDYANAFGYMAQRFDSINKTNITGLINTDNLVIYKKSKKQFFIEVNKVPYIEFRIHSQPVIYDNQDVVMMYPKINEGIVIELVVAVLTDNETQLYFRTLNKDDEIFIENISKFQQVYDRNFRDKFSKDNLGKKTLSGRGGDIEEVVIIVIRDLGSGPRVGFPSSGIGQGEGGGCGGYHMCQPPAGEGGGGGEPNDPNPNQTDPCEKAKTITSNPKTANLMNDLKGKTTSSSAENGYILNENNGTISETAIVGEIGQAGIDFQVNGQIDGFIHSHYAGLLSVFSVSDIFALAQLYKNGNIKNTNTFTIGVVTASGTQYIMVIDDLTKFDSFADNLFTGNTIDTNVQNAYETIYGSLFGISTSNSSAQNESNFIDYLERSGTGLKILKGSSDFKNWGALSKDSNGNVKQQNCL